MDGEHVIAAEALADRISDLLCAWVRVRSEDGTVLADTGPYGRSPEEADEDESEYLRVHTDLQGQPISIAVGEPQSPEKLPRGVAYTIINAVVRQRVSRDGAEASIDERNQFITHLLVQPLVDERQLLRQARKINIDLDRPRVVFLVEVSEYLISRSMPGRDPDVKRHGRRARYVIDAIAHFLQNEGPVVCGYLGNGRIAVLKSFTRIDLKVWSNPTDATAHGDNSLNLRAAARCASGLLTYLKTELRCRVYVSVGRFYPGLRGLGQSYSDANTALEAGRRVGIDDEALTLDRLGIDTYAWLHDDDVKVALAHQLISPIQRDADLWNTLVVFFDENCSLVSAAHRLSLHRNTLAYRLDKIAGTTGLDPRTLDDATKLRMAMLVAAGAEQHGYTGGLPGGEALDA